MSSKVMFGFFAAVLLLLLPLVQRATADCLWEEKVIIVIKVIIIIKVIIVIIQVIRESHD